MAISVFRVNSSLPPVEHHFPEMSLNDSACAGEQAMTAAAAAATMDARRNLLSMASPQARRHTKRPRRHDGAVVRYKTSVDVSIGGRGACSGEVDRAGLCLARMVPPSRRRL